MVLVLAGWLAVRVSVLMPSGDGELPPPSASDFETYAESRVLDRPGPPPQLAESFLPYALERLMTPPVARAVAMREGRARAGIIRARRARPALLSDAQILALFGLRHYIEVPAAESGSADTAPAFAAAAWTTPGSGPIPGAAPPVLPNVLPSRWRLSGWAIARPGGGDPRLVPLLGGSQAGARVSYALDARHRAALFARVATPLSGGGGDQAVGIEVRSDAAPVTAFVEVRHRAGLGLAPGAGIYGGLSADAAGFRLEGYGQAGIIGGRAASAFAEGQARATRRVAGARGFDVDAGAGLWGAAQRGAARLDVGPTLGVALPLGRGHARLTFDWRQQVAGNARPGSGPALSLGTDF
jgi:hypothetical protein